MQQISQIESDSVVSLFGGAEFTIDSLYSFVMDWRFAAGCGRKRIYD
jgi:hypothetical protein